MIRLMSSFYYRRRMEVNTQILFFLCHSQVECGFAFSESCRPILADAFPGVFPQLFYIAQRRLAEKSFVLPIEV